MTTEEFIADAASRGWSKSMIKEELGINEYSFKTILEAMPPIKWPKRSLLHRDYDRSRMGFCSDSQRATLELAKKAVKKKHAVSVGSFHGTIPEQMVFWGDLVTISLSQVNRRRLDGMPLLDALFLNKLPSAAVYKHGHFCRMKG